MNSGPPENWDGRSGDIFMITTVSVPMKLWTMQRQMRSISQAFVLRDRLCLQVYAKLEYVHDKISESGLD